MGVSSWSAAALLFSVSAWAVEAPAPACRRDGATVVCDAEGFRILTEAVLASRTEARVCGAQLEAAQGHLADARGALAACETRPPPPVPPPAPRSPTLPLTGLAAGVVGALGLAAAVTAPWPDGGRYVTGAAGLALLGLGVALVIP